MKILSFTKHAIALSVSKPLIAAGFLAFGLMAQPAQAALTFNFNYLSPGQGFDDPTFGADRKAALNDAANALGAYFSSYTANLVYDVTSYSTDNSTLASAGSSTFEVPGTFQQTFAQSKILSNGNDANGAAADGVINWNFFHDWGLFDTVGANQLDFKSTAMHELLHSFGFSSYIENGGVDSGIQPGNQATWLTYDKFLTDAAGNRLVSDDGIFDPSKVAALTDGTENAAGVFFSGENALAATNGTGIAVYSPNPWVDGSSIAHLDDNSTATNTSIMNAAAHNTGLDTRTLGSLELAVLKDIGYTQVAAVPVPSAVWFMLSGLVGVLGVNRRRKTA
ncbi:MAG: VPLPA-CTERM sorting domain-containing protein [Methylomonas sp.]|jgi:hypothetical protein|uniref:hypothetical protein n=1 Tax=Methylomonas sp. TaxID=418 RepID=UPI0025DE6A7C|nr:hypothetical protein [Methylomonas sp.]MCK9606105.1 VPLPA-CTERM sorting domain-containing protein [Methylomonas sp.]